jgi:hypothetical protein
MAVRRAAPAPGELVPHFARTRPADQHSPPGIARTPSHLAARPPRPGTRAITPEQADRILTAITRVAANLPEPTSPAPATPPAPPSQPAANTGDRRDSTQNTDPSREGDTEGRGQQEGNGEENAGTAEESKGEEKSKEPEHTFNENSAGPDAGNGN